MYLFSSRSYVHTFHPGVFVLHMLPSDSNVRKSENLDFGAATVKLVQPSAYRVGPLLINCSVFDLGIFHFSDTLQTQNARLDKLYHLVCNFVSVSCELTP